MPLSSVVSRADNMSTLARVCVALRHVYVVGSQNAGEGECMWSPKHSMCYHKDLHHNDTHHKINLFGMTHYFPMKMEEEL